jgi:ligand-binding sensor domain-containing protein
MGKPNALLTKITTLLFLCFNLIYTICQAQHQKNKAINYQWEQGFKATTGYCLYQDSKGYIWISTENGLMRFNGYDFRLFTTQDGLPDNEIFGMTEDEKGRLWVLPFANSIAYIDGEKVFNPDNDPLLKSLNFVSRPEWIYLDDKHTKWIFSRGILKSINKNGQVNEISHINGIKLPQELNRAYKTGPLEVALGRNIYRQKASGFVMEETVPIDISTSTYFDSSIVYSLYTGLIFKRAKTLGKDNNTPRKLPKLDYTNKVLNISNRQVLVTFIKGALIFDLGSERETDTLLSGIKVGSAIEARDGTIWLGTIGKGIFRFSSTPVKSVLIKEANASILYIKGLKNGMYCTTNKALFIKATEKRGKVQLQKIALDKDNSQYLYIYLSENARKQWIACSDRTVLIRQLGKRPAKAYDGHVKSVLEETTGNILVAAIGSGSSWGIVRYNKDKFVPLDTFMKGQRITALAKVNDVIYAGTLDGLYACYPDKHFNAIRMNPLLTYHITALCKDNDDRLWVANNKTDVIVLDDKNRVLCILNQKNGLQCNRISCMKASEQFIWVGTDNGLFAIEQKYPYRIIRRIGYTTGLNSNQVNCIDICDKRVWVGTVNGVNYFNEDDIFKDQKATNILINSIKNGNTVLQASKSELRLKNGSLAIDFDVIDFSSSAKPIFQYKLGSQQEWITINGDQLYFPTIPVGNFAVFIKAITPNWPAGTIFTQAFYNAPAFYQQPWFIVVALIGSASILFLIIFLIVKKLRKRDRQKLEQQQSFLLLEQMALQSQMSPHFIFNCISAIKQYYNLGEIAQANSFVDSFSLLIRQTFEMGKDAFVSLDNELKYLTHYLDVERARFNNSFQYTIVTDIKSESRTIPVPAMLLQPLVENAIRHGIRHLPDESGEILIKATEADERITFIISDNGIGRRQSAALKQEADVLSLNSSTVNNRRVYILNQLFYNKLKMDIEDLFDDRESTGTKVIISYPININQSI